MSASIPTSTKFSPLQLELLNTFSFDLTDEELKEVKQMLSIYLFKKWRTKVDDRAAELNLTDEDLDRWLMEGR
jgi:hypothetical protein